MFVVCILEKEEEGAGWWEAGMIPNGEEGRNLLEWESDWRKDRWFAWFIDIGGFSSARGGERNGSGFLVPIRSRKVIESDGVSCSHSTREDITESNRCILHPFADGGSDEMSVPNRFAVLFEKDH